jgi:hypothetical protein
MSEKTPSPTVREKRPYTRPSFVSIHPDAIQVKKLAKALLKRSDDECLKLITEMKSHGMGVAGSGNPRNPGKI